MKGFASYSVTSSVGFTSQNSPAKISPAARSSSQSYLHRPLHSSPRAGSAVSPSTAPQAAIFPPAPERDRSRSHSPRRSSVPMLIAVLLNYCFTIISIAQKLLFVNNFLGGG